MTAVGRTSAQRHAAIHRKTHTMRILTHRVRSQPDLPVGKLNLSVAGGKYCCNHFIDKVTEGK